MTNSNDKFIRDTEFGKLMGSETRYQCLKCKYLDLDSCGIVTNELCFEEFGYYFAKDETDEKHETN